MNTLNLKPTTSEKLRYFKSLEALLRASEGRLRARFGLNNPEIKELKKALEKQHRVLSKRPYQVHNRKGRPTVEKKKTQLWIYLPDEIVAQMGENPRKFARDLVLERFAP